MSYYNEYQQVNFSDSSESRLDECFEAWQLAGKPAIDSADFHALCDDYEIDSGDLQDAIGDLDNRDQVDVYY